jgi:hypothetical protein
MAPGEETRFLPLKLLAIPRLAIGDALRSRAGRRRATEGSVTVNALNRTLELGRPMCIRVA